MTNLKNQEEVVRRLQKRLLKRKTDPVEAVNLTQAINNAIYGLKELQGCKDDAESNKQIGFGRT